jgi:hypothetical protein
MSLNTVYYPVNQLSSTVSKFILFADFLDWSLTHEEVLLGCISKISDGLHEHSLYPIEKLKWLSTLRSQFVQSGLCTVESLARLESSIEEEELKQQNKGLSPTFPSSIGFIKSE